MSRADKLLRAFGFVVLAGMGLFAGLAILASTGVTTATVAFAPHPGNPGGNCNEPGPGGFKVETNDPNIVLAAGTVFCVKQSNSNTGTLTADGTTSIGEYAEAAGLGFGVSNYVVYELPQPTPVVTPQPTPVVTPPATPVVTPVPTPVVTPGTTPVVTPVPTPVVTPGTTPVATPPVPAQFAVEPAACRFEGDDTRLRFRIIAGLILFSQIDIYIDGSFINRDDIEIVAGPSGPEAFLVVEPGLRAWTITEEGNPEAVLAEGETLCPTCFAVVAPSTSPGVTPAVPATNPPKTAPPTDIASDLGGPGSTPLVISFFVILLGLAIGTGVSINRFREDDDWTKGYHRRK